MHHAAHDGEVAGGAVADSTLVISGSGRWPRRSQVRGQLAVARRWRAALTCALGLARAPKRWRRLAALKDQRVARIAPPAPAIISTSRARVGETPKIKPASGASLGVP